MGNKPLLTDDQLKILQNKLTEFKKSNSEGNSSDFYQGLKCFYPEFKDFTDKQLDNQIIAQRRLTNDSKWPKFSE